MNINPAEINPDNQRNSIKHHNIWLESSTPSMKAVQSTRCIEYTDQSINLKKHQSIVRSERELKGHRRCKVPCKLWCDLVLPMTIVARAPMVVEQTRTSESQIQPNRSHKLRNIK